MMISRDSTSRSSAQGDTIPLSESRTGRWALAAVLTAGLLAGCEADRPVTGPSRERAPSEAAVNAAVRARSQLEGLASVPDRAHWADGYVWAHDPTSASYTPSSFYSFNRNGGAIQITKPAGTTGQYKVRFTGLSALLGATSTVKVTGYLGDNNYCKPTSPTLTSDTVGIRCFNGNTGAAVNAYYTVFVTRNYTDVAYAHANNPTGTNYAPPANSSWNPAGAIQVVRNGTGNYTVRFTGLGSRLTSNGGHAQVVAVGTGNLHCKVGGWGGSPDLVVSVLCLTRAGSPADAKFNVLFLLPSPHLAYAWADQPTASSYTPSTFYSSNPTGGAISITRLGTGRYSVTWSGLGSNLLDGGDVQVTAYGSAGPTSNAHCKVEFWGSQDAYVRCFSPTGTLVDSDFSVLFGS
jgi:hypothetical protein